MKTLISVVHPHDLAQFSSVLRGADVALPNPTDRLVTIAQNYGARVVRELSETYEHVFTCSPIDEDGAHQDHAAKLAEKFGRVLVPADAPPFAVVNVLDEAAFSTKLALLNELYDPAACDAPPRAVEAFAEAQPSDIARARSLTHFEQVIEIDDTWSFERSAYERSRYQKTIELCAEVQEYFPVRRIIELGACEGLMTEALAEKYPQAELLAVEPSPTFERRLRARTEHLPKVHVSSASAKDVALDADLLVAAEVLYYAIPDLPRMFDTLTAKAIVTSYHGDFELQLSAMLEKRGFRALKTVILPPGYEQLQGGTKGEPDRPTPFIVRRVGCTIRLWLTSAI
jgi:hypothetical protein